MFATFHELADRGLLRERPARLRREQRRGGELSVAVRGGRLGRRPRRPRSRTSGSTTRAPPVEFGAYGLDVDVAWRDGGRIVATGNSFAAPHIAGLAAPGSGPTHPDATPFEVKTILAATASRRPLSPAGATADAGRTHPARWESGRVGLAGRRMRPRGRCPRHGSGSTAIRRAPRTGCGGWKAWPSTSSSSPVARDLPNPTLAFGLAGEAGEPMTLDIVVAVYAVF